jgi:hypothetical protein
VVHPIGKATCCARIQKKKSASSKTGVKCV